MEEEDTLCNILKDTNWPLTVYALICGLGFFWFCSVCSFIVRFILFKTTFSIFVELPYILLVTTCICKKKKTSKKSNKINT